MYYVADNEEPERGILALDSITDVMAQSNNHW